MVLDSAFHHRPWEESHCVKHKLAQNVPFFATERSEKLASFCRKSLIKKHVDMFGCSAIAPVVFDLLPAAADGAGERLV